MKKLRIRVIVTLIVISILTNAFLITYADSSISSQKADIKDKLDDAKDDLNEVNAQKEKSEDKVEDLESKIKSYESQINSLEAEIKAKNEEVSQMQKKLDELEAQREKTQKLLDNRLIALYESGETSYLDVLLSSNDISEFLSNYYLVEILTSADKELIETLERDKKQIEATKNELNNSLEEIQAKKQKQEEIKKQLNVAKNKEQEKVDDLTEQSHELEQNIADYEKKMKELDAKEKAQEEALKKKYEEAKKKAEAAAKKKAEEEAKKKALEEAKNKQEDGSNSTNEKSTSNSSSSSTSTSSVSSSGFIRPIASTYEIGTKWYYSTGKLHGAVDFPTKGQIGVPIYAVADGIVVTSTWGGSDSYGYYVKIKHYNGLYTLYAHASELKVSVGQEVKQGDVIMLSGNTGNSTGPHLHFEVRVSPGGYSNRVNPLNYLP